MDGQENISSQACDGAGSCIAGRSQRPHCKLTEAHYQQAITIALGLNIPNRSSHRGPTPETRLNLLRTDSNRIDAINPHFTNTCLSTEEIRFETVSTCRPSAAPENASDELDSTPADSICSPASIALPELAGALPELAGTTQIPERTQIDRTST